MNGLEKEFYKLNIAKCSYPYGMVLDAIRGKRVHTVIRSGKWGSTDFTKEVVQILTILGVECQIGSDAPRGGKKGTHLEITKANIRRYTINKIISG